MWMLYAAASALCAALVTIFGKIGLKGIDPTTATIVRGVVMGGLLLVMGIVLKKYQEIGGPGWDTKAWTFILLAAVAGAASWIFYFTALRTGPAGAVAVIDKLSVVVVIVVAAIAFNEAFTLRSVLGVILTIIGSILIVFR